MLEVLVSLVCPIIMVVTGIYIVKILINSKKRLLTIKNVMLIIGYAMIASLIRNIDYQGVNTLITYLMNIIVYKIIFKENVSKVILLSSIVMILTFVADMVCGALLVLIFTISEIRSLWYLRILSNLLISIVAISIIKLILTKKMAQEINKKLERLSSNSTLIFMALTILVFTIVSYNFTQISQFNIIIIINIALVIIFIVLLSIFLYERNNYNNLMNEYDNMFSYVQNFEDWIEKEQLNRHEYKNQLAVLRCLTKEKKVKDKIDEILEDNINIEGQAVTNLKNLPTGGVKGLMYYKAAIAQKQKINLMTDVSLEKKGILNKLSEKDIRILCKLIGIYFDNVIEAAAESRKKNLTIEVYELKNKVNIVFSNTFKKTKNMNDRNKKGVSSKGEGRGNGLYFASKLISENSWLTSKQDIIDNYYIQELSIYKKTCKNRQDVKINL